MTDQITNLALCCGQYEREYASVTGVRVPSFPTSDGSDANVPWLDSFARPRHARRTASPFFQMQCESPSSNIYP